MVSKEAEITAMRDCKTHIENETANANHHDILFSCCHRASAANKGKLCSGCGNTSLIAHISAWVLKSTHGVHIAAGCLCPITASLYAQWGSEVSQKKLQRLRWTGSSRWSTLFHRSSISNTDHGIINWKPQWLPCGHQELLGFLSHLKEGLVGTFGTTGACGLPSPWSNWEGSVWRQL